MSICETAAPDRTAQGITLIVLSVMTMAFADAMVKFASADLTLWQIFIARSLFALPVTALLCWTTGAPLQIRAPGWVALRCGLLVLTWLFYYSSLILLDLSVAAVAIYTFPVIIVLLSAVLLDDRVTLRQWGGVSLGFLGVIVVLRPGTDAFEWTVLLPVLGALTIALAMVLTRSKCRHEAPLVLALALQGTFLLAGLIGLGLLTMLNLAPESQTMFPFLLTGWQPMSWDTWGLMALLGVLSAGYFAGIARAYQVAPPSIIATFDYAYLISAALWGFVLFSEVPGPLTLCGMALITLAGLLAAQPTAKS